MQMAVQEEDLAAQTSTYAEEGTMLHAVTACALLDTPLDVYDELTREQMIAVEECINYAKQIRKVVSSTAQISVEKRVSLAAFDPKLVDIYGTADLIIRDLEQNSLHIIDWKFGQGIYVDVDNNDQLLAYALGATEDPNKLKNLYEIIHLHIGQPRKDNFSHIAITNTQLKLWLDSRLLPGVELALSDDPPFNPGVKQCRFCPGKNRCRHRVNMANKCAADIFSAFAKLPDQLSDKELAWALKAADQYEQYIKDLRKHALRLLSHNHPLPGWKLVEGRSLRKWKNTEEAVQTLMDRGFPAEEVFESKPISPAKAEKLARRLKNQTWFQELIEKPKGKPKMAPESDPRPAYNPFAGLEKKEN
jgi:hypothetical protein